MVNQYNISNLLTNFDAINENEVSQLNEINLEFPYFQTSQILLCKGLHNTNSIRYKTQLRKTAAHSASRRNLFQLINQKNKTKTEREKEYHSFMDWILIVKAEKIDRSTNTNSEKIINTFIKNQPKISKNNNQKFFKPTEIGRKSIKENTDLITETLAKVYTKQKYYKKAISAYQKLSLKYPQKSSYFADQIKLITKLKNK
ncbi:MAG: hypothetical protein HN564_06285 [Flavobacteriales bacterium]|mgnify:FL=1|nr:hypothetical protein [Flavobacteriales bacterium]